MASMSMSKKEMESLLKARFGDKVNKVYKSARLWRVRTNPITVKYRGRRRWIGTYDLKYALRGNHKAPYYEMERVSELLREDHQMFGHGVMSPYANGRKTRRGTLASRSICFGTKSHIVQLASMEGDAYTVLSAMLEIIDQPTGRRMTINSWAGVVEDANVGYDACDHCHAPVEECVCKTCRPEKGKEHKYLNGCTDCQSCRKHCTCKAEVKAKGVVKLAQFEM